MLEISRPTPDEIREPRPAFLEIANRAAQIRRAKPKISIRDAVGEALGEFDIPKDEREDYFDLITKELGRRGGAVGAKKAKERKQKPKRDVLQHWASDARRAGFDDPEDYLKHIEDN